MYKLLKYIVHVRTCILYLSSVIVSAEDISKGGRLLATIIPSSWIPTRLFLEERSGSLKQLNSNLWMSEKKRQ